MVGGLGLVFALCCGGIFFGFYRVGQAAKKEIERIEREAEADRKARTVAVGAGQLVQEFDANANGADRKYDGKWLEVTGVVDRVAKDEFQTVYVTLRGEGKSNRRVKCSFDFANGVEEAEVLKLRPGQHVTIGGEYDDGLAGNVVELSECILRKK